MAAYIVINVVSAFFLQKRREKRERGLLPAAEMRRVSFCRNVHNIHAQAELLKVDVEVNVQLVVPVDLHPRV